ncbi:hypothetical protein FRC0135_01942 [Corynebacterium diphtheriae]|nr:hypothetical protein FRC0135_01942 [Corynebacterium diphtheriae]
MPPGLGQVPIELFEYVTVFGGITPGSFFNRDRNKPYRSQRLVPLSFRAAGTDINIARPFGWTGYESSVPWGGTANNVMGSWGLITLFDPSMECPTAWVAQLTNGLGSRLCSIEYLSCLEPLGIRVSHISHTGNPLRFRPHALLSLNPPLIAT